MNRSLRFAMLPFGCLCLGAVVTACGGAGEDELFGAGQSTTASTTTTTTTTGTGGHGEGGGTAGGTTTGGGGSGGQGGGEGGAPPGCGNGVVDVGEQCDGPDLDGKSCSDFGYASPAGLGCSAQCQFDVTGCHATCDGQLLEPGEKCDGTSFDGLTCVDFGFSNPAGLSCDASCEPDPTGCVPTCGDGKQEAGEVCDGLDLDGHTCIEFGYVAAAVLACQPGCGDFDTSGCSAACNGVLEPGEVCDGNDLGGHDCTELGFSQAGGLACNGCVLDSSGCKPTCNDGLLEPGEVCDDGNASVADGCTPQCALAGTTCQNAVPVTLALGPSQIVGGSTAVNAGQHSSPSCASAGPDRLFAVTMQAAGFFTASLLRGIGGAPFDSVLYAKSECMGNGSTTLCADSTDPLSPTPLDGGEVISFPVAAGELVYLYVDSASGAAGDFQLVLDLSTGFNCTDPVPVTVVHGGAMALLGATPGTTSSTAGTCGGGGVNNAPDVVYEVSAPEGGALGLFADPGGTNYDSVMYARPFCDSNFNATCANVAGNGGEALSPNLGNGGQIFVWMDGWSGSQGDYRLIVTPP